MNHFDFEADSPGPHHMIVMDYKKELIVDLGRNRGRCMYNLDILLLELFNGWPEELVLDIVEFTTLYPTRWTNEEVNIFLKARCGKFFKTQLPIDGKDLQEVTFSKLHSWGVSKSYDDMVVDAIYHQLLGPDKYYPYNCRHPKPFGRLARCQRRCFNYMEVIGYSIIAVLFGPLFPFYCMVSFCWNGEFSQNIKNLIGGWFVVITIEIVILCVVFGFLLNPLWFGFPLAILPLVYGYLMTAACVLCCSDGDLGGLFGYVGSILSIFIGWVVFGILLLVLDSPDDVHDMFQIIGIIYLVFSGVAWCGMCYLLNSGHSWVSYYFR